MALALKDALSIIERRHQDGFRIDPETLTVDYSRDQEGIVSGLTVDGERVLRLMPVRTVGRSDIALIQWLDQRLLLDRDLWQVRTNTARGVTMLSITGGRVNEAETDLRERTGRTDLLLGPAVYIYRDVARLRHTGVDVYQYAPQRRGR